LTWIRYSVKQIIGFDKANFEGMISTIKLCTLASSTDGYQGLQAIKEEHLGLLCSYDCLMGSD